jgi:hypothetical protein
VHGGRPYTGTGVYIYDVASDMLFQRRTEAFQDII